MIKAGITGGETAFSGELLRLLVNHPDVEVTCVHAPAYAGRPVSSLHPGFIGEERLLFSSSFDPMALDVAFVVSPVHTSADWQSIMADNPGLRVIFSHDALHLADSFQTAPVYGLSEIHRKEMVRGARCAELPNPAASLALLATYPLARHLMLPAGVKIDIEMPESLCRPEEREAFQEQARREICGELGLVQSSLGDGLKLQFAVTDAIRGMRVSVSFPGRTSYEELYRIYDSVYDDHNFSHLVSHSVGLEEVTGTQKCVVSLLKPSPEEIRVEGVCDSRMRGGAGEAVHIMNLLFGLFEKTGLSLKVTGVR